MRYLAPVLVALMLAAGTALSAQDWPQWRGPSRDAVISAAHAPATWPTAYARRWRADAGEGYSSPVMADGRLFVHGRKDPNELVTALDASSGAIVWQQSYPSAFNKNSYASRMAKGPYATPLAVDGRLFTMGASGVLKAWDLATGKPLWTKDYSDRIDTSKLFCGTAASPILVNGALIVQVGSDVKGGSIAALDPATGIVRWEWSGDGPGYATPIAIDVAGSRQLVTLTNKSVVGIDAGSGAALWSTPFTDEWMENIVTPVWTGSLLVVSGVRQGTHAYRIARTGRAWTATQVWKNADIAMYMSSPVAADDAIYGLSSRRKGQFVAVDATTGATKWATEGRAAEHASTLLAPKHIVFLTSAGTLLVAKRATASFDVERTIELAGAAETWAMPIVLGPDLIVREGGAIVRYSSEK